MSSLAAMLRRLYSSLPSSSSSAGRLKAAAGGSASRSAPTPSNSESKPTNPAASTPKSTRGRSKPTRPSHLRSFTPSSASLSSSAKLSLAAPRAPRAEKGKITGKGGRTHRRHLVISSQPNPDPSPPQPTARDYTFQPYPLSGAQYALHASLNPPHMPLPVHSGTSPYTSNTTSRPLAYSSLVPSAVDLGPFAPPQPRSPVRSLGITEHSPLGDHLRVIRTLRHADLQSALGTPWGDTHPHSTAASSAGQGQAPLGRAWYEGLDPEEDMARQLGEAVVRTTVSSRTRWEDTLKRLGAPATASWEMDREGRIIGSQDVQVAKSEKEMKAAVEGVHALLAQMKINEAEDDAEYGRWVNMDSTRRKRKKKMSKHKFKKRMKATRALRKKLGK